MLSEITHVGSRGEPLRYMGKHRGANGVFKNLRDNSRVVCDMAAVRITIPQYWQGEVVQSPQAGA